QRAQVDQQWLTRPVLIGVRDEQMPVLPVEEFLWCKLYILQRDRCDWPDIINVLYTCGESLDWEVLLRRLGEDVALLRGLVCVYDWVCPHAPARIPASVRRRLGLRRTSSAARNWRRRVAFLDSRAWFAGLKA